MNVSFCCQSTGSYVVTDSLGSPLNSLDYVNSGADPGLSVGGGANPPGGGANMQICQIFPNKLHEY